MPANRPELYKTIAPGQLPWARATDRTLDALETRAKQTEAQLAELRRSVAAVSDFTDEPAVVSASGNATWVRLTSGAAFGLPSVKITSPTGRIRVTAAAFVRLSLVDVPATSPSTSGAFIGYNFGPALTFSVPGSLNSPETSSGGLYAPSIPTADIARDYPHNLVVTRVHKVTPNTQYVISMEYAAFGTSGPVSAIFTARTLIAEPI